MQRSTKMPAKGHTPAYFPLQALFVSGSRYALISANAPICRQKAVVARRTRKPSAQHTKAYVSSSVYRSATQQMLLFHNKFT